METVSIFNTVFALAFVLGLVGLTGVLLRRFGTERLIRKHVKKRSNKRLKLEDFLVIDQKRKLVLVKRDNVEHLILIGSEKDIVVESNIKTSAKK